MAAIPMTFNGVLYDLYGRTTQRVVFIGEASYTDLTIGGGPIIPPQQPQPPGQPIHPIWGPPGFAPPGPGMPPGIWTGPVLPEQPPPGIVVPPPGSPPVIISPPSGGQPVHPIAAPDYIIVDYPGIGKVLVPKPLPAK